MSARRAPVRAGGRVVGWVRGKVFAKRVQASRHFLRTPPAIAFDVSSLASAELLGARAVEVIDTDTGRRYTASIAHICARGFPVNRGHGPQIALTLDCWTVDGKPPARSPQPPEPLGQLPLFGGRA